MGIELSPEIIDFVAGSVAGAVSVAVGQPFDTVKVSTTTKCSVCVLFYVMYTNVIILQLLCFH
jgi:hypothetical protein